MAADSTSALSQRLRHAAGLADPGPTDGQLLDHFTSQSDQTAFAELVSRHGPMVLGVCRRIAGNTHDADDAFQAAFLVLARKARSVIGLPSLAAWLHGVARRAALKAKAAAAKRRSKEATAARPEGVEAMPEQADSLAVIEQEMGRLPRRYREPLVLCGLCGQSRKEVAGQLGVAEGTLASRIAKAREMLADRLRRRGVVVPAAALAAACEGSTAGAAVPPALADAAVKGAAGKAPAGVERIASEVMRAMLLNKLRTTAFLLAAVAVACAAGLAAFARPAATPVATPADEPPKPAAEKLENGVYLLKSEGEGRKVKLNDGSEVVLGKRLSESIGTGVRLESLTNDNTRFYLKVKDLGPLPKEFTESQTVLVVDGIALHIFSRSDLAADGTAEIGVQVDSAADAKVVAGQYKIKAHFRKNPGHRYEVRWTPEKAEYGVGDAVILKLELKNTGTQPMQFTHGGKQRGARDNQFRFIAQEGWEGKALPDVGDPTNLGGITQSITLKPGESYTATVDLSKWFKFDKPDTYRITGVMEMPILAPNSAEWLVLWDDLAVGECSVRVVKNKK